MKTDIAVCSWTWRKSFQYFTIEFHLFSGFFSSVQPLSHVRLFTTPWIAARQASLSITNSRSLLKLMSIKSVMPFSRLILCHPFSSCPQSLPASGSFPVSQLFTRGGQCIGVSASESVLPMNTFRVSPSNEHPGLISFRIDWLDLLAVQGTLKSSPTPQFKSINFSAPSFLHNPTLTSIHDHWKNHSLD